MTGGAVLSGRGDTDEAIRHLQALLQFDTTNPPGNETPAVTYLANVLGRDGFEPVVVESSSGRGNVVARFPGTGELEPLLLYGHVDVVMAEPKHWRHPPFSGDLANDCIWGRGALDMKSVVAQQLMVMLRLRRTGTRLRRDVIFAATADEEVGGAAGMGYLVNHHPDLVRAAYGLSEGGGTTMYIGGKRFYDVRTSEKGTCRFLIRAVGQPGHGSVPRAHTPISRIAEAVLALQRQRLPFRATATMVEFFRVLTGALGLETGLRELNERNFERVSQLIPSDLAGYLFAITHDTAMPTGLRAGHKINVIPSEAEALVDGRYLPGQTREGFLQEVRAVLGHGYEIELLDASVPLEDKPGDALYRAIVGTMSRVDPEATVAPIMLAGATDAKHVARLGTRCLGFSPLHVSEGFPLEHLVHGHDERIPVEGYLWGVDVLQDIVMDFCA